jgi:FkbH-like protein/FkbM family methyltransferase
MVQFEGRSVSTTEAPFGVKPPLAASAEFRIGVRAAPYLADHGFHDMVVLPGSFYIDAALRMDRERSKGVAGVVRNVSFHNPIILSAADTVVRVDVRDHGDGRVEYTFYEAGTEDGPARLPTGRHAARLDIDRNRAFPSADRDPFSVEAFQARSPVVIDSGRFYEKLRDNGNQYGPSFQRIASIWRAGDQCLGRLSAARQDGDVEPHAVHPSVLDAMTQVLASFLMEQGRTFILRSIEKVELADVEFPETLWGHAVLQQGGRDGNSLVGDVRVFDQSGQPYAELSGVTFTVLDRDAADDATATTFAIASNFTAEPMEDALRFWGDHFGVPIQVAFTPYNQVFQQLLDTASVFRKNRDGVNVILVGLEEWATGHGHEGMTLSKERADRCFGDRARYVLPNGLEIVQLNQYETDYVYKEIFEDHCYLRHGIRLQDGDTVVDIGANIGLFSLFVMSRCRNPTIYACEPAPVVYELLKANCEAYGSHVQAVNVGVSDKPKTATLTFYEKSSVFSGFHADEAEDREAIQTVVRNTLNSETSVAGEAVQQYVNELTADRLRRTTHECRMTSVSELIREHQIDKIDLLKIDAEKSELDIIKGIDDRDWPKIAQLVIEIHDPTREAVKRIEELLTKQGFRCAVEHERLLEHSGLFNLYATRGEAAADRGAGHSRGMAGGLGRTIQDLCTALRSFMNEATAPLVLCVCPRTPAAAADADQQAALDDAEQTLLSAAGTIPNVHTIGSASLLRHYPIKDYYDPHSHHAGHIPYTPEGYAAIGTALIRTIYNVKRKPRKVIVLDCDNTLWKGVCGEDGPLGIEVSEPYRRLQEFMVDRMRAGMLLCLCSKNAEADVLAVFDQRTDMVLQREHLVARRINWNSKSDNIKSLAHELNLGLDSFIFVDDNPVDCADVRINCPGVLTLQLPQQGEAVPAFVDHVWAFDHADATEEDHNRTKLYQDNAKREQLREQTLSLKDFIKGLELRVEIAEATDDQLGRVSQLTFRTNQFNFTTIRRSENEIRDYLKRDRATGLVVRVVDRFGDYGLVGVLLYETEADRFKVDTLLLSCRVLGRGVEHALLAHLGQRAVREHKRFVELAYRPTEKNAPVREFMKSIGDHAGGEPGASWTLAADHLASLEYNPDETAEHGHEAPAPSAPDTRPPRQGWGFAVGDRSEPVQRIAESLYDMDRVARAIEAYRLRNGPLDAPVDVAPAGTLQATLLNIWKKVLGRSRIGMNDNFFEVGGTSLRAVQLIATIKKELKQNLSIVSLFECPTVTLLAAKLGAASGDPDGGTTPSGAALRGQRRRNVMRRKAP